MTFTEQLSPMAAQAMLGDNYEEGCTYQLVQDRYEAAVWKYTPGVAEPEVIPIEDTDPVGYDTFLMDEFLKPQTRKIENPVFLEDELAHDETMYNLRRKIAAALCGIIIVACCVFVMGVYYGIFKI